VTVQRRYACPAALPHPEIGQKWDSTTGRKEDTGLKQRSQGKQGTDRLAKNLRIQTGKQEGGHEKH